MSTGNLVATILSLALLTPAGSNHPALNTGAKGVSVAQLQANLDLLGYDAGSVTGSVNGQTLNAIDHFITQWGLGAHTNLSQQVTRALNSIQPWPTPWHGTALLAAQDWLAGWHLYKGPLNGQWNTETKNALEKFLSDVGIQNSGITTADLSLMAHLEAIRVAYLHHWTYYAQPGDQLSQIAWTINMPVPTLQALNPAHGFILWVNQAVHWAKSVSTPVSSKEPRPATQASGGLKNQKGKAKSQPTKTPQAVSSPTPVSTGVFSNIRPVAALVLANPSLAQVQALVGVQSSWKGPVPLLDVAVSGQWALLHPEWIKKLEQVGDEIDLTGYSGIALNQLPQSATAEELNWSAQAFHIIGVSVPTFVVGPWVPSAANKQAAVALNFSLMTPTTVVSASSAASLNALLHDPQGIVVAASSAIPQNFHKFFETLKDDHFSFLTLGQIWAQQ